MTETITRPPTRITAVDYSGYLRPVFTPDLRKKLLDEAVAQLTPIDFDVIVVRGTSGLLFGPVIADRMGKEVCVVRKPQEIEPSHGYVDVEGPRGPFNYVIIDDFIANGGTVDAILRAMNDCTGVPVCVGIYLYYRYPEQDMRNKFQLDAAKRVARDIPLLNKTGTITT